MKGKISPVFLFAALLIFATGHGLVDTVQAGEPTTKNFSIKPSAPIAPDFTLKDLSGKTMSLKDLRGKVVLLDFTTTWCPYCKKDIPNLKKLFSSMKGKNFALISIFINESSKKVSSFTERYSLPYTILLDEDASVARIYGIRGVPTKVVVDKKGVIGCWQCIAAEDKIDELMKER
ncbi:MAG TPA: TlpA disulfide reductase family protein [Desulfomonilia bacterium]|nr:TlpA disulfide reductase family protein [Desulfomonilia bacterium]